MKKLSLELGFNIPTLPTTKVIMVDLLPYSPDRTMHDVSRQRETTNTDGNSEEIMLLHSFKRI